MIGLVGILGCITALAVVGTIVSVAATVVDVCNTNAVNQEREAEAKEQNAKATERQKQSEIVQLRQQQLAMMRAMQSSANSALYNSLSAERDRLETRSLKRKLHSSGQTQIARPTRNYGTNIR